LPTPFCAKVLADLAGKQHMSKPWMSVDSFSYSWAVYMPKENVMCAVNTFLDLQGRREMACMAHGFCAAATMELTQWCTSRFPTTLPAHVC
jgi:hypothetical protein